MSGSIRLHALDGLRGWMALVVALYHAIFVSNFPLSEGTKTLLMHLPFLNGGLAVLVFFFISGFALSSSFVFGADSRSLLRIAVGRYPRLALPIFAACFLTHLLLLVGIIDLNSLPPDFVGMYNFNPTWPHLFYTSLVETFVNFDYSTTYIGPLWTIEYEFIGTYLTLAVLLLNMHRFGAIIQIGIAAYLLYTDSFYFMFLAGLLACRAYRAAERRIANVAWLVAAFGIIWVTLAESAYTRSFLMAATACGFGFVATPSLSNVLCSRVSRFLGTMSFPSYLVHSITLTVLGVPILQALSTSALGQGWLILVGVAMGVAAFFSGFILVPVNEWAIAISRRAGQVAADSWLRLSWTTCPRPSPRSKSFDGKRNAT